ncbi:hypothetical protein [Phytohabitans rumicis]|uniref:hypothetical protein n=1 Tax=Phytohabitans rumicis TaxID=1076125 RepID=UPI00156337A4|nr:hypothetical protein [Phytohabitans rumicis]
MLLNAGVPWGQPKRSHLEHDMRRLLTPDIAREAQLFDGHATGSEPTPTVEVTRLAFVLAVGAVVGHYVGLHLDPVDEADESVRALAAVVCRQWSEPPEMHELRRLSVDHGVHHAPAADGQVEPDLQHADLQTAFRVFVENARALRLGVAATPPDSHGDGPAARRLSILFELAIADLSDDVQPPVRVVDKIIDIVWTVAQAMERHAAGRWMQEFQRRLRQDLPPRAKRAVDPGTSATYLHEVLTKLAAANRIGTPASGRADSAASWDDIGRLVAQAQSYLSGDHRSADRILTELADELPAAVTALTTGDGGAQDPDLTPADARWELFRASGRALARSPEAAASVTVAGSFAELGWVVANEQKPHAIRDVNEAVQQELRRVGPSKQAAALAGAVSRILRARPLADSKHANFAVAQRAAHEAVIYGNQAYDNALHDGVGDVSRVVAALTGLQLSLLQAGGVFIRSTETELIMPLGDATKAERERHAGYIRGLATTSYEYVNLAVARLHDIRDVKRTGLIKDKDINFPATSEAQTVAMGMRTLLLWATMHLACPDSSTSPADVRALIPSVPAQFREMLTLRRLSALNFADLTRIALHYAFLQDDLDHPAKGAEGIHPATPEHLRPAGTLDLDACGRFLTENGYDTGILDVIQVDVVRRRLEEESNGRYRAWLADYANPRKRRPARISLSDIVSPSTRIRATVPW